MAKLGATLATLLERAGVDIQDERLKELLGNQQDIPTDAEMALMGNLLTVETAKGNDKVINHFRSSVLSGADKRINDVLAKHGISLDDFKDGNTYDKIEKLGDKIADLYKAKAGAEPADKKAIQAEIDGHIAKIKTLETQIESVKQEYEGKFLDFRKNSVLESEIRSFADKLALPGNMPFEAKKAAVMAVLNNRFTKEGIDIAFGENNEVKLIRKEGGIDYLDPKQNKLNLNELLAQELAENNLVKTSTQESGNNPAIVTPPGGQAINLNHVSALDMELEALNKV